MVGWGRTSPPWLYRLFYSLLENDCLCLLFRLNFTPSLTNVWQIANKLFVVPCTQKVSGCQARLRQEYSGSSVPLDSGGIGVGGSPQKAIVDPIHGESSSECPECPAWTWWLSDLPILPRSRASTVSTLLVELYISSFYGLVRLAASGIDKWSPIRCFAAHLDPASASKHEPASRSQQWKIFAASETDTLCV